MIRSAKAYIIKKKTIEPTTAASITGNPLTLKYTLSDPIEETMSATKMLPTIPITSSNQAAIFNNTATIRSAVQLGPAGRI